MLHSGSLEGKVRRRSGSAFHTNLSLLHRHGLSAWGDLLVDAGQEVLRDAQGVL